MNLGIPELLVLGVIALLVFGPKRLPEIARSMGKALRAFQDETSRAARELRSAVEEPESFPSLEPPPAVTKELSTNGKRTRTKPKRKTPAKGRRPAARRVHEDT
jgi:TatA/E family protein of Tat protein translocase